MKFCFIALGIFAISCNFKTADKINDTLPEGKSSRIGYQILKIDSLKDAYVIYARKDSVTYKIVSMVKESRKECTKIQIDSYYDLNLISCFARKDSTSPIIQLKHIEGMGWNGTIISLEDKDGIVRDLFYSDDLDGVCYFKK